MIAAGALLLLLVLATILHSHILVGRSQTIARENQALVARLGATDIALFTEARYTRHPSQADLHTPFQDHPGAFEHFPSGSLIGPPPRLRDTHARLDRATEVPD